MTTMFANTNTTISQLSTGSTTVHYTSYVSSVTPATTCVSSIIQSPQGMLRYIQHMYGHCGRV